MVDGPAWFKSRGATPPSRIDSLACTETKIGAPPRDALRCHGPPSFSTPGGESVFSLYVYTTVDRAGGKKAAQLALEVAIAAGPMDREAPPDPNDPNEGQYIALEATLDASRTTITVREKTGAACAASLAQYKDPELAPHRKVINLACAAKGTYRWTNDGGGRFVKSP